MSSTLGEPRPEWIVFDAADTLLRAEPSVPAVYREVAGRHGVDVSETVIMSRFRPAIQRHFSDSTSSEELDRSRWQQLVFDVLETDCTAIFDDLWQHFAEPAHWRLYDDVALTWSWLEQQGYRLVIGSNFDARLLGIVSQLPPIHTAEQVFVSSQMGYRKPGPEFFRRIESALESSGERMLMVGDSLEADFKGAKNAGWQALLLDRQATVSGEHVIVSLESLTSILPVR